MNRWAIHPPRLNVAIMEWIWVAQAIRECACAQTRSIHRWCRRWSCIPRAACDGTSSFKVKSNAHNMCAQESSLYTYHIKNRYKITNVIIYNIYYWIMSYKRLSWTLLKAIPNPTVPYQTRGGICCPGVSTPKIRSLADSSTTYHDGINHFHHSNHCSNHNIDPHYDQLISWRIEDYNTLTKTQAKLNITKNKRLVWYSWVHG
jgi:hypothetical protein